VKTKKISICLLSGGIDSMVASTLAANEVNSLVYLLSIFYGQGAERAERMHATLVADKLMATFPNVLEHFTLEIVGSVRKSTVSRGPEAWTEGFVGWRSPRAGWEQSGYPSTRDEVFSLIAAAGAEARLRDTPDAVRAEVVLATNRDDLGNFGDLKPSNFLEHLQEILNGKLMPSRGKPIEIKLPLIDFTKSAVVALAREIGAPLELTWSCYFGEPGHPCGNCDQCRWRADAFRSVGIEDSAVAAVRPKSMV
jgi:7-cyano-7-deazaguanine synthase